MAGWFYKQGDKVFGPVEAAVISGGIANRIWPNDLHVTDDKENGIWKEAHEVPELVLAASAPTSSTSGTPVVGKTQKKTPWGSYLFLAAFLGVLYLWLGPKSAEFTKEEIAKVEKSIREEFVKRDGVTVNEVTMLQKTPKELFGFAKIRYMSIDVTKNCTATMNGDGRQYIWKCD